MEGTAPKRMPWREEEKVREHRARRDMALGPGNCVPQGTEAVPCLVATAGGWGMDVLLTSGGLRRGMLLNVLQPAGQPPL